MWKVEHVNPTQYEMFDMDIEIDRMSGKTEYHGGISNLVRYE